LDDQPADEPLEAFYGDDGPDLEAEPKPSGVTGSTAAGGGARRHGVAGALMAGIAMGLRDVFDREYHDRTAIEQPAPEQPMEPQKYEIHLDPVTPESSFAIYRPWVDGDEVPAEEAEDGAPAPIPAAPAERPRPVGGGGFGALGG
jgi:hypothetical protein